MYIIYIRLKLFTFTSNAIISWILLFWIVFIAINNNNDKWGMFAYYNKNRDFPETNNGSNCLAGSVSLKMFNMNWESHIISNFIEGQKQYNTSITDVGVKYVTMYLYISFGYIVYNVCTFSGIFLRICGHRKTEITKRQNWYWCMWMRFTQHFPVLFLHNWGNLHFSMKNRLKFEN